MATLLRSSESDSRISSHEHRSNDARFFAELPLFRDLSNAELEELLAASSTQHAVRQQVVYCAGERLSHLYVVQHGSFKLVRHSEEGKELIVALVQAGESFGACAESVDSPTLAQALQSSSFLVVPTVAVRRTLSQNPDFAVRLIARALDRHRGAETAAARLAFESVPARLAHLLLDTSDEHSGEMSFPLNQTEIANLIGSSRETVCSILNQFRRGGWLEIDRGHIRVTDRSGLGSVH